MTDNPGKTIMIVDDEPSVLSLAEATLLEEGYRTLLASSGEEALRLCDEHPESIDVAIIDVVMPRMSGPDLAERLRQRRPDAKLLFTSGYGAGAEVALRQREPDAVYLKKPFGPDQLSAAVARVLGD